MIGLRTIDENNFQQCLRLHASVEDESFADPVVYSLAEAWTYRDRARPFAIYDDDKLIGFVLMYAGEENPQIVNFLIDDAFRGRGLGTAAAKACVGYLRDACRARRISAPVKLEHTAAQAFWKKLGFQRSDSVEDGYVFMRLALPDDGGADAFLRTERLLLRKFRDEDFADFRVFAMDEERNLMIGNARVENEAEARALFLWLKDEEPRAYAVVMRETGRVVGDLTVYGQCSFGDHPALAGLSGRELSFSMARRWQRRGLMEEAVRAVIGTLFDQEGADYVADGYFACNAASAALHEKLGFSALATIKVPFRGKETDLVCCVLRRETWRGALRGS